MKVEVHFSGTKLSDKSSIIYCIIFALIGVGVITIAILLQAKASQWISTDATIVDIQRQLNDSFSVFVDFTVDATPYSHVHLGSFESWMKVGDIVPIKYNPANPYQIEYARQGFYNVFYIIGSFCILLGAAFPTTHFILKKYRKNKFENGFSQK